MLTVPKTAFFLNINECSSVTKDQGQCHLLHHTEIHQLSKKWALPVTQEYVRCKIFAACSLALGRRWLCLLLGNHVLQKRKELILNACPAPFSLKGVNSKIAHDHGPPWTWGPSGNKTVVSLVLIICSASGLGSLSGICSVQALPDDVGGSQSLIWHNGYVNVIWVPCTFAWGLLDGGTFQTIKVIAPCKAFMPCSLLVMI